MFIDELKAKFPDELIADFSFTVFGEGLLVGTGVKSVSYLSREEIRLRANKKTIAVRGSNLTLAEIGGFEIAIKGKISAVEIID